jgi:aminoglycoside phosphotransferase (APT) family kinase protein
MSLASEMKKELERGFGDVSDFGAPSRGLTHQTFVFSSGGKDLVAQVCDDDRDKERALRRKAKVYELAEEFDVKIPKLVKPPNSFSYRGVERIYFVVKEAEGKTLEKGFDESLISQIGQELARIHEMDKFDRAGWLRPVENGFEVLDFEEESHREWILSEFQEDIEVLRENGFGEVADSLNSFLEEYRDQVEFEFEPVLCHNDYSPDNILSKDGEITGVIDFDYVFSSDPRRDLVKATNSFAVEGMDHREDIYNSYLETRELENFREVEPFYRVETLSRITASFFHLDVNLTEEERKVYSEMLKEALRNAEEVSQ